MEKVLGPSRTFRSRNGKVALRSAPSRSARGARGFAVTYTAHGLRGGSCADGLHDGVARPGVEWGVLRRQTELSGVHPDPHRGREAFLRSRTWEGAGSTSALFSAPGGDAGGGRTDGSRGRRRGATEPRAARRRPALDPTGISPLRPTQRCRALVRVPNRGRDVNPRSGGWLGRRMEASRIVVVSTASRTTMGEVVMAAAEKTEMTAES